MRWAMPLCSVIWIAKAELRISTRVRDRALRQFGEALSGRCSDAYCETNCRSRAYRPAGDGEDGCSAAVAGSVEPIRRAPMVVRWTTSVVIQLSITVQLKTIAPFTTANSANGSSAYW